MSSRIALFRQIVDAASFIVAFHTELDLTPETDSKIVDILRYVCSIAHTHELEEVDKLFLLKDFDNSKDSE